MPTTPPEFAAAGLDHSVQLYQLTLQVKRLRKTVQRIWGWIGALVLIAGVSAAYDHLIPPNELVGESLVLGSLGGRRYAITPRAEGLSVQIGERNGPAATDLLLRSEGERVWIEKAGRVLWESP